MRGIIREISNDNILVELNTADNKVSVNGSQCQGNCGGCSGCGMSSQDNTYIDCKCVSDKDDIKIGEEVEVEISPDKKILSSLIVFLLPIGAMMGAFKISLFFTHIELINGVCSILGLVVSVVAVMFIFKIKTIKNTFKPKITKIHFE